MRKISILSLSLLFGSLFLISCEKDEDVKEKKLYPLKETLYYDEVIYIEIAYEYDINNRLKKGTFIDENNKKFETVYEYNEEGKLTKMEHSDKDGVYLYDSLVYNDKGQLEKQFYYLNNPKKNSKIRSMQFTVRRNFKKTNSKSKDFIMLAWDIYEYSPQGNVSKILSYYEEGIINEYNTYEHDAIGNTINEKYYSEKDLSGNFKTDVFDEIEYQYDNKNHYGSDLNTPMFFGLSRVNNIIKEIDTDYNSEPETTDYTLVYNEDDFPIEGTWTEDGEVAKVITEYVEL